MNNNDRITFYLKRALDFLFISNPQGTVLGMLLGFVIDGLLKTFLPLLPNEIVNALFIQTWQFTAGLCGLCVLGFNIKPYNDRKKVNPKIIEALNFIEQRELTGQITKIQAQMEYQALIKKVISEVTLNDNIAQQLNTNQQQTPEVE
ncbi:MAG: hypothetical protein WAX77_15545 [Methylococcaceae bacterium]